MAGKRRGLILLPAVTVIAITGLFLAFNPILVLGNGFEWNVEIGTTLDFIVSCRLVIDNETGWTPDEAILQAFSLNGTTVTANVTSLPAVRYVSTAEGFTAGVIEYVKVSVMTPIGTLSSVTDFVALLISRSLLPAGNFDFIDSLYPDYSYEMHLLEYHWEYLSYTGEDSLVISHVGREHHGSKGWWANVSKATGCPTSVCWFDYRYHDYPPYAGYSLSFRLDVVIPSHAVPDGADGVGFRIDASLPCPNSVVRRESRDGLMSILV